MVICRYEWEEFEDTKGMIRRRKSKKHTQQITKRKETNNELQNITKKTKDWTAWTSLKSGVNWWPSEG